MCSYPWSLNQIHHHNLKMPRRLESKLVFISLALNQYAYPNWTGYQRFGLISQNEDFLFTTSVHQCYLSAVFCCPVYRLNKGQRMLCEVFQCGLAVIGTSMASRATNTEVDTLNERILAGPGRYILLCSLESVPTMFRRTPAVLTSIFYRFLFPRQSWWLRRQ